MSMYITSFSCPTKIKLPIRPLITAMFPARTWNHAIIIRIFKQPLKILSFKPWRKLVRNNLPLDRSIFFLFWAYLGIRNAYRKGKTNKSVLCDDNDWWDAKTACCMFPQALNCTEFGRMDNATAAAAAATITTTTTTTTTNNNNMYFLIFIQY